MAIMIWWQMWCHRMMRVRVPIDESYNKPHAQAIEHKQCQYLYLAMLAVVQGAARIHWDKQAVYECEATSNGVNEQNTTSDDMVRDCFKIIARRNDRIGLHQTERGDEPLETPWRNL
eukprot:446847_1